METIFLSSCKNAPVGFKYKTPTEHDLLYNRIALYTDSLEVSYSLLDKFPERVNGLVISKGEAVSHSRIGPELWHFVITKNMIPDLHKTVLFFFEMLSNSQNEENDSKQSEKTYASHLHLLKNKEKINNTILKANDIKQMMSDVLQATLEMFDCDRSWLLYPCDPKTETWRVPMMRTTPDYKDDQVMETDIPVLPEDHEIMEAVLKKKGPVGFGSDNEKPLPSYMTPEFGVKTQLLISLYPKTGKPWIFGLHQCRNNRCWTKEERELLKEISHRLSDALSSLLFLHDLKESEENLRITLNSIGDAVISTDTEGIVTEMNPVAEKLTGWSIQEARKKPLTEILHVLNSHTREPASNPVRKVLESGEVIGLANHTLLISKDGSEYQIADSAAPIRNTDNQVTGVVMVFRDISKEYQLQEELTSSEEKFRTLFESSMDAILLLDLDKGYIDCNPAALNMFAVPTKKKFLQLTPADLSPIYQPDGSLSVDSAKKEIQKSIENGVNYFDWQHKRFDGDEFSASVLATKVKIDNKIFLQGTIRDITKRKQSEVELSHLRNYLYNIINSMPSILIGVDKNCKITQWNKKAEESTGIIADEAQGKILSNVFPRMASEMEKITKSMNTRKIEKDSNRPFQTEKGIQHEDVTIYPLVSNEIEGAVIRIDDVTKKNKLEEQLNHSRKLDAIGQLAGGVAHDFNNMLGGIMGAAELLKHSTRDLDKKSEKLVKMIIEASKRAADLTSKLLIFGRKGKITSKNIDLHSAIDDIIAILKRTIDKRISISVNKNAKISIIKGDRSELESTFINMGINASHAMPKGGELHIKTKNVRLSKSYCDLSLFEIKPGEYIEIEVRDIGFGIPKENLNKIFDPFFTTKKQGKGSGLGLSAAYGAVLDHNGEIKVYSELEKGTVFYILLPCAEEKIDLATKDEIVIIGSGHILLIDDDDIIRDTGKLMLEAMGYNVTLSENGENALRIFREQHNNIDLIISDMIMPEMNGREVYFEMKKIDKNCRVMISSGFSKSEYIDELKKAGLSGFIRKPFRNFELSQLIANILLTK